MNDGPLTRLFFMDGKTLDVPRNLEEVRATLQEPGRFVEVAVASSEQRTLVNPAHVVRITVARS